MSEELVNNGDPLATNSDEVNDIMSRMPSWLIRRGITILFGIILLLLSGSFFIHYPDVITTNVSIFSANIPVRFVAKTSGKIVHLFKRDGDLVHSGDAICLIENPAFYEDVVRLRTLLKHLEGFPGPDGTSGETIIQDHLQLGEMQSTYSDLIEAFNQYSFFRKNRFAARKIQQLQDQVSFQGQLNVELARRDSLLKLQLRLGAKKFAADSSLAGDRIISPVELDDNKNELIGKQLNVDVTKSAIIQNNLQQTEYIKTITDLQQQAMQQEDDFKQRIMQDIKKLTGEYAIWEGKYLIRSPVEGKVVFFKIWKENQYINTGENILMVVPPIENYTARSLLPVEGAGKVKVGQAVSIRLSAYPYQEFGSIKGTVSKISMVPLDTSYAMEIDLPHGLRTNINIDIPPQSQISGIAEVYTANKSIFQRLFENIWLAAKKY